MGLGAVIISSSAGGLSILISLIAIRRKLRRQKTNRQEASSELVPTSRNLCPDARSDQHEVFIKNCSDELMCKRGAVVDQPNLESSEISVASDEHTTEESYVFQDSGMRKDHNLNTRLTAEDLCKHDCNKSVTETRQDTERSFAPLKEFTTQASDVAYSSDHWEDSHDRFESSNRLSEDRAGASGDSGSETESCSFGDDAFLSEEETGKLGAFEHGNNLDSELEVSKPIELQASRGKRVSFQLEDYVGQHREFSNSVLDGEKTVAADIYTGRGMDRRDDMVSVPENDDTTFETWDEVVASASIIDVPETQNRGHERRLSMVLTPLTETHNMSDVVASREVRQPQVNFEDQSVSNGEKLSLVSVEPLAHVTALDDVVTALPSSMTPAVLGEHNFSSSMTSNVMSTGEKRQWECNERENSKALLLPNEVAQVSHRSQVEEKESDASNAAPSAERLPRQPRRGSERYGMFRRSSHPTVKRFRFSDRIKVRPLRSSGRNSN